MKRVTIKLVVFLLAGAIINVAVAWGSTLWLSPALFSRTIEYFNRDDAYGAHVNTQRAWEQVIHWAGSAPRLADLPLGTTTPAWAWTFQPEIDPAGTATIYQVIEARGWPVLSMIASYQETRHPQTSRNIVLSGVMLNAPSGKFNLGEERVLPLLPLFPGFAINTIFYAAILWALFAVPGAVRRRVRIKRGQCASCGYSLRGSASNACPECGAAVLVRNVEAHVN